ncbi:DUF3772 domain-containing protein [Aliiroseovarius sp. 2305UL8-7]|uniref:DUF3772 domain-containing protein n=1 Tax=Aliiroseovarius conchicola TaxID=3121637 RepID=UPI0035270EF6
MQRPMLVVVLIWLMLAVGLQPVLAQDSGQAGAVDAASAATSDTAAPATATITRTTTLGGPDYNSWDRLANRVEQALEVGRVSDTVLRELRGDVADWREVFDQAKDENSVRINTLKTQIATLGPKPENDGVEPAVLTERRDQLTVELNAARVPVKTAEEAFSRADLLIDEIDKLLRVRQADQLLQLGPTPLNPVLWPDALADLGTSLRLAWREVSQNWGSDAQRTTFLRDLPLTLVLLVVGLVLLARGRIWVMRIGEAVRTGRKGPSRGVIGFVVSLGQVIAPLFGMIALVEALNLVGILGLRGQAIVDVLPGVAFFVFGSLWIGNRMFGTENANWPVIDMPSNVARAEAKFNVAMLGLILSARLVLNALSDHEGFSDATLAVLHFPLFVAIGLLLIRMARLLRLHRKLLARDDAVAGVRARVLGFIATICSIVGYAGPTAAAIGYQELASGMLIPLILTLGLLALLEVFHRFIISIYGALLQKDEEAAEQSLWPVLVSFALTVLMLPLLALIWGAQITDLTELWSSAMNGFQLGSARITPRIFVIFAIVFLLGYWATRLLQSMLRGSILPKTSLDKGVQNAISVGVGYVGIFLAAVVAITSAGIDLSSIAIIAGALSVGIGFGLQNVVSNFVSGIILLIERPISEGDWIEVGGQMGYVRNISVRSTQIETFDRTDVILPNSDLVSGVVTNFTRGNSIGRVIVPVGVGYGTDTKRVEAILQEIAEAHPMVTVDPAPSVVFQGFGASSFDFEIRAILSDVNYMLTVKSDMNHEIARRFVEEGIEIPFAQRDIWLRNPEALTGATPAASSAVAPSAKSSGAAPNKDALTVEDLQSGDGGYSEGEGDE